MLIETKPRNYWKNLLGACLSLSVIVITLLLFKRGSFLVSFMAWLLLMLIPVLQSLTIDKDHIHSFEINDETCVIKWRRLWKEREDVIKKDEVRISIEPYLKRTYRMKLVLPNVTISQLSSKKEWSYELMTSVEKELNT